MYAVLVDDKKEKKIFLCEEHEASEILESVYYRELYNLESVKKCDIYKDYAYIINDKGETTDFCIVKQIMC